MLPPLPLFLAAAFFFTPQALPQLLTTFAPTVSGTVAAPVVGASATSSNYLLTGSGSSFTLPQNFTGNGQDTYTFDNPAPAKDAASFNDDYHFQLSTGNDLRQVSNLHVDSSGVALINSDFQGFNIPGAFGIGYDSDVNRFGVGSYSGGNMTLRIYDVGSTTPLGTPISFSFDTASWGTPTGLDYVRIGGQDRFLVTTRDFYDWDEFEYLNKVLDINATTGVIDQYFTTPGDTNKLQDVLYDKSTGNILLGYDQAGGGFVELGQYGIIPEPKSVALLGLGAGALALARRRTSPSSHLTASLITYSSP